MLVSDISEALRVATTMGSALSGIPLGEMRYVKLEA